MEGGIPTAETDFLVPEEEPELESFEPDFSETRFDFTAKTPLGFHRSRTSVPFFILKHMKTKTAERMRRRTI